MNTFNEKVIAEYVEALVDGADAFVEEDEPGSGWKIRFDEYALIETEAYVGEGNMREVMYEGTLEREITGDRLPDFTKALANINGKNFDGPEVDVHVAGDLVEELTSRAILESRDERGWPRKWVDVFKWIPREETADKVPRWSLATSGGVFDTLEGAIVNFRFPTIAGLALLTFNPNGKVVDVATFRAWQKSAYGDN